MALSDDELSALIRDHATRHTAGDRLRADVRTQIALADAGRSTARPRGWWQRLVPGGLAFGWRTAVASFALGVAATLLVLPLWRTQDLGNALERELIGDHVRSMQGDRLVQVESTDRHTVKPWFQGRLDYAPPVIDLQADGFPLRGGRVEDVRGEKVAALVYMSDKHVMNVFVWPGTDKKLAPHSQVDRGFNVVHWSDGAMQYWIVSDVEHAQIERFVAAWQRRAGGG
jgi:anti-sigma factor RsiW